MNVSDIIKLGEMGFTKEEIMQMVTLNPETKTGEPDQKTGEPETKTGEPEKSKGISDDKADSFNKMLAGIQTELTELRKAQQAINRGGISGSGSSEETVDDILKLILKSED